MITCQKCGRPNEDHYRFCLGCGARLADQKSKDESPLDQTSAQKPLARPGNTPTPAQAPAASLWSSSSTSALADQDLSGDEDGVPTSPCPVCEYQVPVGDIYCGRCGARTDNEVLKQAELILLERDGTEGRRYPLEEGENIIGRSNDAFRRDTYISPRHARFLVQKDKITVEDAGSLNGVFVRIPRKIKLLDGARLRVGLELLEFREFRVPPQDKDTAEMGSPQTEQPWGRLARVIGPEQEADAWLLTKDTISIGRDAGDILFSQDAFVSGSHATLTHGSDGCTLEDLNSSNGTYLQIPGRWELKDSDVLLLGQQIVRLSMR